MPAKQRTKYGRAYTLISERLRVEWANDPTTRCCFCHLTYAEGVERYGAERAAWQTDHPDGRTDRGLRPAHLTCNSSDGAKRGNAKRNPSSGWI